MFFVSFLTILINNMTQAIHAAWNDSVTEFINELAAFFQGIFPS
jgi:hypothetical protein